MKAMLDINVPASVWASRGKLDLREQQPFSVSSFAEASSLSWGKPKIETCAEPFVEGSRSLKSPHFFAKNAVARASSGRAVSAFLDSVRSFPK